MEYTHTENETHWIFEYDNGATCYVGKKLSIDSEDGVSTFEEAELIFKMNCDPDMSKIYDIITDYPL